MIFINLTFHVCLDPDDMSTSVYHSDSLLLITKCMKFSLHFTTCVYLTLYVIICTNNFEKCNINETILSKFLIIRMEKKPPTYSLNVTTILPWYKNMAIYCMREIQNVRFILSLSKSRDTSFISSKFFH